MKEIMKELVKLAVMIVIVMAAFFGFMAFVAVMWNGLTFLPKYIGEFGTFMLYIAVFMLIISAVKYFTDKK